MKKQTDFSAVPFADLHTHILPSVDDGSRSAEEAVELLRRCYEDGAAAVALTPHFYPDVHTPKEFLAKREDSFALLTEAVKEQAERGVALPKLHLGGEVAFFCGISACEELNSFCFGDRLLLLEMPFHPWSENEIAEVGRLRRLGVRPLIAHLDRYFSCQKRESIRRLLEEADLIQLNAEAFLHIGSRGRVLSLLSGGYDVVLGSDCHNLTDRVPNIGAALAVIEKKTGLGQAIAERSLALLAQ